MDTEPYGGTVHNWAQHVLNGLLANYPPSETTFTAILNLSAT